MDRYTKGARQAAYEQQETVPEIFWHLLPKSCQVVKLASAGYEIQRRPAALCLQSVSGQESRRLLFF